MEPNEVQVVPALQRLAVLTAVIGVAGAFNAPTVMLYQNAVVLSPRTAIADLTVATFVGYANVVGMAWSSPYIDVDGSALVFGTNQTIVCTSAATPNTIYGYALTAVALASLWAAFSFAAPIGIANVDDAVSSSGPRYSGN